MKQRIISLQTLQEKQFKILNFEGYWMEVLGQPESNFKVMFWGKSGSGKSTIVRIDGYIVKAFVSGGHKCNLLSTASSPPACTNAVLAAVLL